MTGRRPTSARRVLHIYLVDLISFTVIRWEQFYADSHYSRGNIARFYSQILILLHTCCVFLGLMHTGLEICWWSFGNPKKKVVFLDFLMSSDYDLGEKSTPKSLWLLWSLADSFTILRHLVNSEKRLISCQVNAIHLHRYHNSIIIINDFSYSNHVAESNWHYSKY